MNDAYRILLGVHVILGTVALAAFWAAVLAPKRGRLHRACGVGFATTMFLTAATAVPLCLLLLADPLSARPPAPEITAAARAHYARTLRLVGAGLLEVSLITGVLLQFGLRALRRRVRFSAADRAVDLRLAGTAVVAGIILLGIGFLPGLPYFRGRGIALALVAAFEMRALLRFTPSRSAWIGQHLAGVIGAASIGHGALAVNVARNFTSDVGMMFLPAGPTVLLFAVAIRWLSRRWRQRLERASRPAHFPPLNMSPRAVNV
jgi:hypothetical protein